MKRLLFAVLCLALTLTGCNSKKSDGEVVHREGLPDVYRVPDEDKEMEKAVQKARASVDMFIAALKSRKPTQSDFSIKKPFKYGDQFEHIWLSDASFDGTQFHGRVDNDPVDVKKRQAG
jgi:uncharacterized protein YegJ (DUF2314 family)